MVQARIEMTEEATERIAVAAGDRKSMPLCALPRGVRALIVAVEGSEQEQIRLKRIGLCLGREVSLERIGDPCVVHVVGARLGLSRLLATKILCEVIAT